MTEELFYLDPHMKQFTARVLSCREGKECYEVILDRTAFYPEGGGQAGDRGVLGGVAVTDTRTAGGETVHFCAGPLSPGAEVTGKLDWAHRFDLMQQHSGEHIVSGVIHGRYGCDNTGFHLGAEVTAIDFNLPLTWEELKEVEREANERVWADVPVETFWPDPVELAGLEYRSRKELHGSVRIVRIPGADVCACCGVHVARTGEIGLIKIISAQKLRGGVRALLVCGRRAYEYTGRVYEQNRIISGKLSASPETTAAAVDRVCGELEDVRYRLYGCEERLFRVRAVELAGDSDAVVFHEGLDSDGVRRLASAAAETCSGRIAVFSGKDGNWRYAIVKRDGDVRDEVRRLNAVLNGRGGGKPGFAQGSVQASREEIEGFFSANKS